VSDAGSFTGRVGDLGLGLTKPVCGGDGGILVFGADLCVAVDGWAVDFEASLVDPNPLVALVSGAFDDALFDWLWLGVVGVFTALAVFGEDLGTADVFAVDIAAGRDIGFSVVGRSPFFACAAGLELPFAFPFGAPAGLAALVVDAAVFLVPPFAFPPFEASCFPSPSCLLFSVDGVSIATSGIISSTIRLFLRALNSVAIDSFLIAVAAGSYCSSTLKLSLRFDKLGSPLLSLWGFI
jgi:hypothetical protein